MSDSGKLMTPPVPPRPTQTGMFIHHNLSFLVSLVSTVSYDNVPLQVEFSDLTFIIVRMQTFSA